MPPAGIASRRANTSSSTIRGVIRRAPMVKQVARGEETVLADFHHDRYYTLSPVSSRIWELLAPGITLPALLAQLHDEYDAPAERVDADARAFLETLRAARLITCEPSAAVDSSPGGETHALGWMERAGAMPAAEAEAAAPEVGRDGSGRSLEAPSVLRCALLITAAKLALRIMGFGRTWRWLQRRAQRVAIQGDASPADIAATEYRVALVAALWPGRALCLEQSLVLYYVLRRAGVLVEFRMGVQPHPFLAHAWVEHHGAPVNDFPEHVGQIQPLEGMPR